MTTASIGSLIDHYKIIDNLGHGGMGVVYKALNIHLDKIVAIKTIGLGLSSHENFISRFQTEARALAKLENPNIVRIYDLRVDDNQWYIVMEYVEGGTLADRIQGNKAIPYLSALPIMKQLLNAIGHAHRVGIIHRDIKPNNVMITRDGIVKVTDFGLAKDQHHHNNTFAGSTGGTLYYMSPEQVKGLLFTDHRSDIYSLGLTFYEMLAGKIPFRKDDTDFAIREAIIKRQFPPPSHFNPLIPVALNSIVMRAIEKNPEQRYQAINEMLESIIKFEKHETYWAPTAPKKTYKPDSLEDTSTIVLAPETVENSSGETKRSRKPTYRTWIWIPAAILFPVILWFLLSNTNLFRLLSDVKQHMVTIRSNPDAALIIADGDTLGRTPLFQARLSDGTISLLILKDNFIPVDTSLQVSRNFPAELVFHLQEKFPGESHAEESIGQRSAVQKSVPNSSGRIRIQTQTDNVLIYQDGRFVGVSPLYETDLETGDYVFHFKKEGYATLTREVQISSGNEVNLNVRLVKQTAVFRINSVPAGAEIILNGNPVANTVTPAVIEDLETGVHNIILKKNGYVDFKTEFKVNSEKLNLLDATLSKASAKIKLLVKPWGTIYIDNQLRKENTNVYFEEVLSAGEHLLSITHPTYGTWEKSITVPSGKMQEIIVDYSQMVNVRVTAFDTDGKPVWANIIIDDIPTGNMTPKEISVRIGKRTFAAHKDGYEMVGSSLSLMLDRNLNEPLKFILRRQLRN